MPEVAGFMKNLALEKRAGHILQPNANHSVDKQVLFASNLASIRRQRPNRLLKAKFHLLAIPIPGSIAGGTTIHPSKMKNDVQI